MTRDSQFDDDGILRDVDRIEFNRLEFGRIQWQLWSGDVLTHSEIGGAAELPALLGMTALFLQPPEESDGETATWTDPQECEFPGRLD